MGKIKLISALSISLVGGGLLTSIPFISASCGSQGSRFVDLKVGANLSNKYLIFNKNFFWLFDSTINLDTTEIVGSQNNPSESLYFFTINIPDMGSLDTFALADTSLGSFAGHYPQRAWDIADNYWQFPDNFIISSTNFQTRNASFNTFLETLYISSTTHI